MRLSDIKGERTIEVLADLIEPIANIAASKHAEALFKPKAAKKGEDAQAAAIRRVRENLPALLRENRDDLVAIMATLNGKTPDEYASEMTLASLVGDVYEIATDEDFLSFIS